MRSTPRPNWAAAIMLLTVVTYCSCDKDSRTRRGETTVDVGAGPDLFPLMDGGLKLSEAEIKGRNAWHL
jgi:hypothetical protein